MNDRGHVSHYLYFYLMTESKKTSPKEEQKPIETEEKPESKAGDASLRPAEKHSTEKESVSGEKGAKKAVTKVKKKGKAKRRLVTEGKIYIQATYNNTVVTITDTKGEVIAWSSAGSNGFKGAKKATPYAAQISSETAANKAKVFGFERGHVIIKGVGSGREQAIRGINSSGINIESIRDVTAVAHNGCRPRKSRRV